MAISKEEVVQKLCDAAFGKPLISNMYRGLVAEIIVASELPEWRHCSEDWNGWDFEHRSGCCNLEVKQSAALQTWSDGALSAITFGIAESKFYWVGKARNASKGRKSSIYVFAHHAEGDPTKADHRDPLQWSFYVLPASRLPSQKTIALRTLMKLSATVLREDRVTYPFPCNIAMLRHAVDQLHDLLHLKPPVMPSG